MKLLKWLAGSAILAALLLSCSSPSSSSSSSDYTMKVLPSNLSVTIPKSLSSSSGSSSNVVASKSVLGSGISASYTATSYGFYYAKYATTSVVIIASIMAMYAVISDAILSQNSLGPGTYPSVSVTLTKEMYNTMVSFLPEGSSISSSAIGSKQALNNLVYSASGAGTFKNSLDFSIPGTDSSGGSQRIVIEWSADNTKLRLTQTSSDGTVMYLAKDTSNGSTALKSSIPYGGSTYTSKLAVAEKANSDKGVYLYQSFSISGGTSTFGITLKGYADNTGGAVQSQYSNGTYPYTRETFNATGTLLYAASSSTENGTYTLIDPIYANLTSWNAYVGNVSDQAQTGAYALLP